MTPTAEIELRKERVAYLKIDLNKTHKEIGADLGVPPKTAEYYWQMVVGKIRTGKYPKRVRR